MSTQLNYHVSTAQVIQTKLNFVKKKCIEVNDSSARKTGKLACKNSQHVPLKVNGIYTVIVSHTGWSEWCKVTGLERTVNVINKEKQNESKNKWETTINTNQQKSQKHKSLHKTSKARWTMLPSCLTSVKKKAQHKNYIHEINFFPTRIYLITYATMHIWKHTATNYNKCNTDVHFAIYTDQTGKEEVQKNLSTILL